MMVKSALFRLEARILTANEGEGGPLLHIYVACLLISCADRLGVDYNHLFGEKIKGQATLFALLVITFCT